MPDQLLSLDTFADGALLLEVREAMALLGSELSREDIAGKGKSASRSRPSAWRTA